MEFNLVNLKITVRTPDPVKLGLRLAETGGAFAGVCRRLVCDRHSVVCESCPVFGACAWQNVFSQKISADPVALKRHQKPPLPFVFSYPLNYEAVDKPGIMECGLVVIGSAIPHLDLLLRGFAELLACNNRQEEGEIIQVGSCDYQGDYHNTGSVLDFSRMENLVVLSAGGILELNQCESCRICIRLLSPLKMVTDGRQSNRFDFSQFACSLMRRVSSLASYYAEYEFDSDFKLLSSKADAVDCIEDHFYYFPGIDEKRKLSGIYGHGRFRGEFNGLLPFLLLGRFLHVGKGASFGMGRYEIFPEYQ